MNYLETCVIVYLILSVIVAIFVIGSRIGYGNSMSSVPSGDWEFYEYDPPVWERLKWVFLPSLFLIWPVCGLIKLINRIF